MSKSIRSSRGDKAMGYGLLDSSARSSSEGTSSQGGHARPETSLSSDLAKGGGSARCNSSPHVKTTPRSLKNRDRLGRLRRELAKISPAPASAEEARLEIVNALARAHLQDWTVPELGVDANELYADGSLKMVLIAHAIWFNPSGAFRIVDVHPPQTLYFELAGAGDKKFVLPEVQAPRESELQRMRCTCEQVRAGAKQRCPLHPDLG